jgi:Ca2+/Na+ antiporter
MSEDVAGATFMAAAVSCPELFVNVVGTFITEGDIGVGTIVGSAVFNVLAVPACCGLFAKQVTLITLIYVYVDFQSLYMMVIFTILRHLYFCTKL